MELLSFSVSTPFWIWLLFALATAYYYDVMKKRINRLEQRLSDLSGWALTPIFYDLYFHNFRRGTRTAKINISSGFLNRLKSKASKTPNVFVPLILVETVARL